MTAFPGPGGRHAAGEGGTRTEGLIVPPGDGRTLRSPAQEVTVKVSGTHCSFASTFEVVVPPGFDVGAHLHSRGEELFHVLEGELDILAFEPRVRSTDGWRHWRGFDGRQVVRATPGTVVAVPAGCPHAFANPTDRPARMFFQYAPPPLHERYFDELFALLAAPVPDPAAIAELRRRYDIEQLTPLRHRPPVPHPADPPAADHETAHGQ